MASKEYHAKWYQQNKERVIKRQAELYLINKEKKLIYAKEYRAKNKNKIQEYMIKWNKDPDNIKTQQEKRAKFYLKNKKRILARNIAYKQTPEGKERIRAGQRKWEKNNPVRGRIRCSIKRIIRNANAGKVLPVNKYGIIIKDLITKLESDALILGYTLKQIQKLDYHIDHIIPISLYNIKLKEDIIRCCNCLNLRWLPAKENLQRNNKLRPEDIEIIKTLPKKIYPISWKGKIPKETT